MEEHKCRRTFVCSDTRIAFLAGSTAEAAGRSTDAGGADRCVLSANPTDGTRLQRKPVAAISTRWEHDELGKVVYEDWYP